MFQGRPYHDPIAHSAYDYRPKDTPIHNVVPQGPDSHSRGLYYQQLFNQGPEDTDHAFHGNRDLNHHHDLGAPSGLRMDDRASSHPQAFTSQRVPGRYDDHPQHQVWDRLHGPSIPTEDDNNGRLRPVRELPPCFHALYDNFRQVQR